MNRLQVEPHWSAAIFFVAYLYMMWALTNSYHSFVGKGDGGFGIVAFAVMALPIGAIALSVSMLVLLLSFKVIESPMPRVGILVFALLVFLAGYGAPNAYILLVGAALSAYGYVTEKRRQEDESDLAEFE